MKITIIGTGNIGKTEGLLLSRSGHKVIYGSRNPSQVPLEGFKGQATVASVPDALACSDIILLAIPWAGLSKLADDYRQLMDNKIIIDATNPYVSGPKGSSIVWFRNDMAALEHTMSLFPKANVVKAFNTLTAGFQLMAARKYRNKVISPFAGDNQEAKTVVGKLISDMGFIAYDIGDARMSRFIDPPRGARSLYGEDWTLDTIAIALDRLKNGYKIDKQEILDEVSPEKNGINHGPQIS